MLPQIPVISNIFTPKPAAGTYQLSINDLLKLSGKNIGLRVYDPFGRLLIDGDATGVEFSDGTKQYWVLAQGSEFKWFIYSDTVLTVEVL